MLVARSLNTLTERAPDYTIDIAPVTVDLSPHHRLTTTAYNGQIPGPLLRFTENQPDTIEVFNRTDRPEVLHWHGLFIGAFAGITRIRWLWMTSHVPSTAVNMAF